MARPRTGTVDWRHNAKTGKPQWYGRWTRGDGTRTPWKPLDPKITETDVEGAKRCAATFAPTVRATTKDGAGETVAKFATRWLAQRPAGTAKDNLSHLTHHVFPVIGEVSILRLTSAQGDELVASLDRKIEAGTMSDKTARNVWGTVGRMLRDAAHAKPATGLRCLDVNPFKDVQAPERSKTKRAKQFLYPSEFVAFVSCADVPAKWRRNVAIATYLGLRDGEQRALRWAHVDLEHGIVNVCETTSKGEAREGTKSGATRRVPIPAALLPLLAEMHEAAGGDGLVCRGIASQRAMARGLRTWLRKAGVTRTALFTSTSVNLNVRWHDLRATCGTWLAVVGRSATEIRDVLGHTQVSMTDRYMRDASAVRGGQFGTPFPPLPPIRQRNVMTENAGAIYAESRELLRGGRDSKATTPSTDPPSPAADRAIVVPIESSPLITPRDEPRRSDQSGVTEPSDAELERAIVSAVTSGALDVARVLAGQLEDRRRARAGNVVPFDAARRGRA